MKHYFWVCPWGCFWKRLVFDWADWVKRSFYQCGQASSDLLRTHMEQKGEGGVSSGAEMFMFSCPWTWELQVLGPLDWEQDLHTSLAPPADGLQLQTGTIPLACSCQITELLSLPNCMSQSLVINLVLYIYLYISYWFWFSEEPWLIPCIIFVPLWTNSSPVGFLNKWDMCPFYICMRNGL